MSKAKPKQPVFDFSDVSRKWATDVSDSFMNVSEVRLTIQDLMKEGEDLGKQLVALQAADEPDEDAIKQVFKAQQDVERSLVQAYRRMKELSQQQGVLLAKVLVSVPAGWLVSDAPKTLDWTQVETQDWIKSSASGDLMTSFWQTFQADSKN